MATNAARGHTDLGVDLPDVVGGRLGGDDQLLAGLARGQTRSGEAAARADPSTLAAATREAVPGHRLVRPGVVQTGASPRWLATAQNKRVAFAGT